ncbi:pilin [Endozoicomonas atrinae]|uniref:pilin n=1 Tax=Endozoicomonas atrinae TaxID=1333660 RepID=UPI0008241D05|nr:pilin [Endozoicomonas atrinae]
MKKQQGFTLIELMIAVAIIGILAAVAIPQYQNYVARAQVSEAVTLLGGLKTPVIEYYSMNGTYPDVASVNATGSGEFVSSITRSGDTYVATFSASGVNERLQGAKLALVFSSSTGPNCTTTGQSPAVPPEFLPNTCK